ncbi:MAG: type II secretion system protein [Candidatus Saccharibacteria bacterium]|nr:type II secretion system protein [Candidatus Saccharibacteria bacterium]
MSYVVVMHKKRRSNITKSGKQTSGFTIVEVLIVLAIAGLILLIVFLAVPALQRNARNNQRKNDARLLHTAVAECLTYNANNVTSCDHEDDIPLDVNTLSIYTGFHYGKAGGAGGDGDKVIPTIDEPNWLFGVECHDSPTTIPAQSGIKQTYSVGYFLETTTGTGYQGYCL